MLCCEAIFTISLSALKVNKESAIFLTAYLVASHHIDAAGRNHEKRFWLIFWSLASSIFRRFHVSLIAHFGRLPRSSHEARTIREHVHFRYSITVLHQNPLWCDFQYWRWGQSAAHHYTLFNDAIAYFFCLSSALPARTIFSTSPSSRFGFFMYLFLIDWSCPSWRRSQGRFTSLSRPWKAGT